MTIETVAPPADDPLPQPETVDNSRVDRNFLTYLSCQLMSWVVTFFTVSLIPRALGEANSGKLVLAGVATNVPIAILGFGVEQFIVKEIGRDRRQASDLVGGIMGLRLALLIPAALGSVLIGLALHAERYDWLLIFLMLPSMAASFFSLPMKSAFSGLEQAKRAGSVDLLLAWSPLFALPFLRYGPIACVFATMATTIVVALIQWRWIRSTVSFRMRFDLPLWIHLVRGGIPFCVNNYLLSLYGLVSTFVVRHLLGDQGLGAVGQVSKLFGTFMFIPTAMVSALLPALARMADKDREGFDRAKPRVLAVLLVFGLPVTATAIVLAEPLCHLLYSRAKFVDVPLALQTIALGILPMYIVSTMYQFLAAQGRAHVWSRFLLLTVAIFGVVAWVATPLCMRVFHNGPMGASVATVISECAGATASILLLRVNLFTAAFMARVLRAFGATLLMAVAMRWTLSLVSLVARSEGFLTYALQVVLPGIVGAVVFAALVVILKILYPQDQQRIGELMKRVGNRLRGLGGSKRHGPTIEKEPA